MKNSKGITLIALVITIIVLLILAGVSLSLVLGQNGTLGQASSAVIKNKCATAREKLVLALADAETEYNVQWANNVGTKRSDVYPKTIFTNLDSVYDKVEIKGYSDTNGTAIASPTGTPAWISNADVTPAKLTTTNNNAAPTGYSIKFEEVTGDIYYFDVRLNENTGKSVISETVAYQPGSNKAVEVFVLK